LTLLSNTRPASATASIEAQAAEPHRPSLRSVIIGIAISVSIACLIPAVLFYVVLVTMSVDAALVVALAWTCGAVAWRRATSRAPSGLLALTLAIMVVRTVTTLASGNTFIYFLQPVVSDGVVAVVFLLSLLTTRPVVARLAGDFYPMTLDLASRPRIRRLLWRLTLLWGIVCLTRGLVGFWLLESQSLMTFVLVKNITLISITLLATVATVAAATMVARKEGLLPAT
jgi:intracellular septation protein A